MRVPVVALDLSALMLPAALWHAPSCEWHWNAAMCALHQGGASNWDALMACVLPADRSLIANALEAAMSGQMWRGVYRFADKAVGWRAVQLEGMPAALGYEQAYVFFAQASEDTLLLAVQRASWNIVDGLFLQGVASAMQRSAQLAGVGFIDAAGHWLGLSGCDVAMMESIGPTVSAQQAFVRAEVACIVGDAQPGLSWLQHPVVGDDGRWIGSWRLCDSCARSDWHAIARVLDELRPRLLLEWRRYDEAAFPCDQPQETVCNEMVELAQSIREIEALVYSLSHQFESPVRALRGFAIVLKEDYAAQLDATAQDYLERIARAGERIDRLTLHLLSLSKLSLRFLNIGKVDLARLARDAMRDLVAAERRSDVCLQTAPSLIVHGDPGLLALLLTSLLQACLALTRDVDAPVIELGSVESGAGRSWFLRCNGHGFDVAALDSALLQGRSVEGLVALGAVGIGVAIARRLLRRMHGSLMVESAPGAGSCFRFAWPAAAELVRRLEADESMVR